MKKVLYPLLTLLLGTAGYLVHARQLSIAIDSSTGLPIFHHPLTYALIGGMTGAALLLLILSIFIANEAQNWYAAFHSDAVLPRLFSFLAALGFSASTALIFQLLLTSDLPQSLLTQPFLAFFGLLMIFACLAAFFLTLRNGESGNHSLATLIPGFTCCIWLVLTYHNNASNSSVLSFAFQLLAASSGCLAWYFIAGFAFQRPHSRRTVFFSLLTVILSMTALADRTELYQQVLLASTALWFLGRSVLLIDNAQYSGKRSS